MGTNSSRQEDTQQQVKGTEVSRVGWSKGELPPWVLLWWGSGGRFETRTFLRAKSVQRGSFFPEKREQQGQGREIN